MAILGSGFVRGIGSGPFDARDVTQVTFGGSAALDIEVVRDDMLSVRTPPGAPGFAPVVVKNPNGQAQLEQAFSYFDTVRLDNVTPRDVKMSGGSLLTVIGVGFTSDTQVLIDDRPASQVTVQSAQRITLVAPPHADGSADLTVVNRNGQSLLFKALRYHSAPRLDQLQPSFGPTGGGTLLVASGLGIEAGVELLMGTTSALNLQIKEADRLEATSPSGNPGPIDVTLRGICESAILPGGFLYLGADSASPNLLGVTPNRGPSLGGKTVWLVGRGFSAGVSQVWFGSEAASEVVILDDNSLSLKTPALPSGLVSVSLRTIAGEILSLSDSFTAYAPLGVSGLAPQEGPAAGGTPFALRGGGFAADTEVLLGGAPAADVMVVSSSELTGRSPPGSAGLVDMVVRDRNSQAVLSQGFRYLSELGLTRVEPDNGSQAGGTYLTVTGSGFGDGTRLYLGNNPASLVAIESESILRARAPRGEPGQVNVRVERGDQSQLLKDGYAYIDPTNQRGGAGGGPLRGALNISVLDGNWKTYGEGLAGATVQLSEPLLTGTSDSRGQVTFSGPALVRAATISIAKPGFESVTIVALDARNLSVFLFPYAQEPYIPPEPRDDGSGGEGNQPTVIRGRVYGFKEVPGTTPENGSRSEARVRFTSYSLFSVPPFQGISKGTVIERDGDEFQFGVYSGDYALYSMFGSYREANDSFTPLLLGVRRAISVRGKNPVVGQDIILSTYLDQSLLVSLVDPPISVSGRLSDYAAYASLDLGSDGVIYLSQAKGKTDRLTLQGLPLVSSSGLLFTGLANLEGSYPYSYVFRRTQGGLENGLRLGPFLGFPELVTPAAGEKLTNGRIAWTLASGETPAFVEILMQTNDLSPMPLWRILLPGDKREVVLPPELLDQLPQLGSLILTLYIADAPRFDFNRFTYSQLSSNHWTRYAINFALFDVR